MNDPSLRDRNLAAALLRVIVDDSYAVISAVLLSELADCFENEGDDRNIGLLKRAIRIADKGAQEPAGRA